MAIFSLALSLLPFALFIAAGFLVRRSGDPERVRRRFFLFLAWTALGLAALVVFASWQTFSPYLASLNLILSPVAAAAFALAVLNGSAWRELRPMDRSLLGVGMLALAALITARALFAGLEEDYRLAELSLTGVTVLVITASLVIAWTLGRRSPVLPALLALAYLGAVNLLEYGAAPFLGDDYLANWQTALYLGIPGAAVAALAFLAAGRTGPDEPGSGRASPNAWGRLALGLLILAVLVYTCVWLWIWDGLDDGIRGLFMLMVSGQTAAAGAVLVALAGPLRRIWVVPVFIAAVTAAVYGGMIGIGTRYDPYTITENRAARIGEAVEAFRAESGAYPAALAELVPGAFWRLPRPLIFTDQGWCYEAGPDFYRLGAVYRENWSSPIIEVRVYSSAGSVPAGEWVCDEQREVAQEQYGMLFNPPTPVPLPTGVVPVERTVVEPIMRGASFSTGRWSPDGAYLVFGLTRYYDDLGAQMEIDLHFLSAATGAICRAARPTWQAGPHSDGLRDHFAWLPDGRGLYVSDAGEMVALTPCGSSVEDLAGRYPVAFDRIFGADPVSGRILLGDGESFWLLEGTTLAAAPVSGLDLRPDDVDWSYFTWSPDGSRLAASVLVGPETGAVYIVDAAAGALVTVLPLEGASEASLPIAEWLSRDELLLHGNGLRVLDLGGEPPAEIDLVRDIFLLDATFPDAFSSLDFLPDLGGEGYVIGVRIDHPRNAGVYLYTSATGAVDVFRHDTASTILFPDGRRLRFTRWEDEPTFSSAYTLVRIDRPGAPLQLTADGHSPRAYPILSTAYLPMSGGLVFYSSQGISLVSPEDGATTAFWVLEGAGDFFTVFPAPGEEALVVVADGVGVYHIPLDSEDDLQP